jgi:hypothetical protein
MTAITETENPGEKLAVDVKEAAQWLSPKVGPTAAPLATGHESLVASHGPYKHSAEELAARYESQRLAWLAGMKKIQEEDESRRLALLAGMKRMAEAERALILNLTPKQRYARYYRMFNLPTIREKKRAWRAKQKNARMPENYVIPAELY